MENETKITTMRFLMHHFFFFSSKLTILVLQNECGILKVSWARVEAYAVIGKNFNMDIIMPRTLLHKSRSFFERAIKNRQKKTTTRSFENWWRSFSLKRKAEIVIESSCSCTAGSTYFVIRFRLASSDDGFCLKRNCRNPKTYFST